MTSKRLTKYHDDWQDFASIDEHLEMQFLEQLLPKLDVKLKEIRKPQWRIYRNCNKRKSYRKSNKDWRIFGTAYELAKYDAFEKQAFHIQQERLRASIKLRLIRARCHNRYDRFRAKYLIKNPPPCGQGKDDRHNRMWL